MKVSLSLLALLLVLALVASACGDGQPAATHEPTATSVPVEGPGASTGGKISFESDLLQDGITEIYTVNADGTQSARLTSAGAVGHAWSPDGSRIAFSSGEPFLESPHDIYVVNADGSGLTRLTDDPSHEFLPKWSLDGDKIAFISNGDGNLEIHVMNADGSERTNLTNDPAEDTYGIVHGLSPLYSANPWSPDGQQLAFNRMSEGGVEASSDTYVMNADGSGQARISEAPALFGGWSPDGDKLLLFSGGEEGAAISLINADGTGLISLIDLPGQNPQGFPVWSPNGQRIAFTADREGKDAIYAMNSDGSGMTPLSTGTGATGFEGCDGLFGTAWSPDGDRIAFTSGCDFEKAVLLVINADGSSETRIADPPAFSPAWSPAQE